MKFQRTDLIVRVKDVIAAKNAATVERNAKAARSYIERRDQYTAKTGEAWKQFADTIRVRLRTGKPIICDDIPRPLRAGRVGGGYLDTWDAKAPDAFEADTFALEQLLVLLEAATDEEITTSALERMGFRTAQLFTTR